MSTKRKRTATTSLAKKGPIPKLSRNKRSKRKPELEDSDLDSELSDSGSEIAISGRGDSNLQPDEVLIAGHGDAMDDLSRLPEQLLNTLVSPKGGQLLLFGCVNWDTAGGRKEKAGGRQRPNLFSPHLFTDKKIRYVGSGCVAAHSVIVDDKGVAYTFGRNQCGQLGQGNTITTEIPAIVPILAEMNVIAASCGRNHTLFLTDTGTVYACGDNKSGQCGVGNLQPTLITPTRINYRGPPIVKVGCGADFSLILDMKGGLHSFGLPEFGQLGHNTDGKYFKSTNKLSYNFETSPKRIVLYIEKGKDGHVSPVDVSEIVDFNCGQNHAVAIDGKRRAFSWGFGGFGRLGHAEQKDEMVPRLIKYFDSHSRGLRSVHCGSTYSLAVTDFGVLFMFGQTKRTGEANMYPKPVQDLAGWNINVIATGQTSIMISADDSMIAWGASPTYGELGLGEFNRSSAAPKEVSALSNIKVIGLAMGLTHTMVIALDETEEQKNKLEEFDLFDP